MLVHFSSAVKLALLLFVFCSAYIQSALAEDPKAPEAAPIVIELFSSQACAFCPKADVLLATLAEQPHIIGIDCHVDYFDVQKGSLAQKFCTDRQTAYAAFLRSGPNYTPQMVMNGVYDMVGYKQDLIEKTMAEIKEPAKPIGIQVGGNNQFSLSLPAMPAQNPLALIIVLLDKPHNIKIAEGGNRGKEVVFKNIASDIQKLMDWDGEEQVVQISVALKDKHQGFAALVQDQKTGAILAAGAYKITP